MLNLPVQIKNNVQVMSSVDLAELCGVRHDHFMVKAVKVLGGIMLPSFREREKYGNGNTRDILMLPEREACLMAMSYSYELQAKVYDAYQALKAAALPQTFSEALQLAANQAKALELAAPKVEFVDRYVESKGNKTFREVAKLLGIKERQFRSFLVANKIQYVLNRDWVAYQNHVDAGRFIQTTGENNGHAFCTCRFTPKGVVWISGLLKAEGLTK